MQLLVFQIQNLTCLDGDTLTWFALALHVLCSHGGCVMLSTVEIYQITLVVKRPALVNVAICAHCSHGVKLPPIAEAPRHGGHIVAAPQSGVQVFRNTCH